MKLENELILLRELLPPQLPLLIGGRAAPCYETAIGKIGAIQIKDLIHLDLVLGDLRKGALKSRKA